MNVALKKLNKKRPKQDSIHLLKQLQKSGRQQQGAADVVSSQLIALVKQTGLEALNEVKTPLNPILSWFDEAQTIPLGKQYGRQQGEDSKSEVKRTGVVASTADNQHLARLPMKSPPCKRCPALSGGLCKCALKRLK